MPIQLSLEMSCTTSSQAMRRSGLQDTCRRHPINVRSPIDNIAATADRSKNQSMHIFEGLMHSRPDVAVAYSRGISCPVNELSNDVDKKMHFCSSM
ncbi:hypothetical protein QC762_0108580 [Podospora pseudocomata]|uniref:Uncharacterized protein n=1 Tax=Podospora pseudocomata TaxID=2093779 RepID=A0ABR0G3J1_9PEZI|nr:hypothetical protein QC762_0108580 [Podospora pseudocomata]